MEDNRDALELTAQAGISTLALVVPPASLLGLIMTRLEQNRLRRQAEALRALHDGLERVADRVDQDRVTSEEFEAIVEEVIEKAGQRKEIDKRDYYAVTLHVRRRGSEIDGWPTLQRAGRASHTRSQRPRGPRSRSEPHDEQKAQEDQDDDGAERQPDWSHRVLPLQDLSLAPVKLLLRDPSSVEVVPKRFQPR